jgi:hypothetical protein
MKIITNNSNITNTKIPYTSFAGRKVENSLSKFLDEIMDSDSYEKFQNAIKKLLVTDKNAKYVDVNLIKSGDYFFKIDLARDSKNTGLILKALKEKGISIIPEYIKTVENKDGFGLTVMKIDGAKNGDLLSYDKNHHLLTIEAKDKAYNDIKYLMNIGIINPEIFEKPNQLKIVPGIPHKIVCENWSCLKTLDDYLLEYAPESSKEKLLEEIKRKIYK